MNTAREFAARRAAILVSAPDDRPAGFVNLRVGLDLVLGGTCELRREIRFWSRRFHRLFVLRVGMASDGMSAPSGTWVFIGHPYSLSVFPAALLHDAALRGVLYAAMTIGGAHDRVQHETRDGTGDATAETLVLVSLRRGEARVLFDEALGAMGRGRVRRFVLRCGVWINDERHAFRRWAQGLVHRERDERGQ